jgi:hypothetical protein
VWVVPTLDLVDALPILDDDADKGKNNGTSPRTSSDPEQYVSDEVFADVLDDEVAVAVPTTSKKKKKQQPHLLSEAVLRGVMDDEEAFTDQPSYGGRYIYSVDPTDSVTSETLSYSSSSEGSVQSVVRDDDDVVDDDESLFHCDIYVTQQSDPWSRPVQTTRTAQNGTRFHWGCRPDVPSILAATAARVTELHRTAFVTGHTTARVAVVACGPTPLVAAAKRAAREQSSRTGGGAVVFDFHEEIFDY